MKLYKCRLLRKKILNILKDYNSTFDPTLIQIHLSMQPSLKEVEQYEKEKFHSDKKWIIQAKIAFEKGFYNNHTLKGDIYSRHTNEVIREQALKYTNSHWEVHNDEGEKIKLTKEIVKTVINSYDERYNRKSSRRPYHLENAIKNTYVSILTGSQGGLKESLNETEIATLILRLLSTRNYFVKGRYESREPYDFKDYDPKAKQFRKRMASPIKTVKEIVRALNIEYKDGVIRSVLKK